MFLAIDIGNTNINLGLFRNNSLIKRYTIASRGNNLLPELKKALLAHSIDDALICSVAPKVTSILEKNIKRLSGIRPYLLGKNFKVPIKNLYRRPQEVGQDRLVNAFAGVILFGAPLIVVDFGTAITFDVVSKNSEYLGGMILPGLRISLDALKQRTALLPQVSLSNPKSFIGKDTKQSMLSGIVYGFASLTDDLSLRIKHTIGKQAKVVGTGGDITLISKYCKNLNAIDQNLTLKGLNLLYRGRSS